MTLISSKNRILLAISIFCALPLHFTLAQDSLTLSVTPPLIQNIVEPGDVWQSQLKVINPNPFPLTVYIDKVHFLPEGEAGRGVFQPVVPDPDGGSTLPEWIDVTAEPITIEREESSIVPFIIEVPADAPPGGHYAALLVGTKPPEDSEGPVVKTSQLVTSLFFVQIEGDIDEVGLVREFRVEESLIDSPQADFVLRFENKGNVHVQPQGDITIFNMWGKERGVIPINHKTQFGNVLPDSVRKFTFSWTGEPGIADIGRYTALATIGYGTHSKQFVSGETSFWVIPIKATLIGLTVLFVLIWFIIWAIKLYVRRMLALAGVDIRPVNTRVRHESAEVKPATLSDDAEEEQQDSSNDISLKERIWVWMNPIKIGLSDFRQQILNINVSSEVPVTILSLIHKYRIFFAAVMAFILLFVLITYYISDAQTDEKNFAVSITDAEESVVIDSEVIRKQDIEESSIEPIISTGRLRDVATTSVDYVLHVVNASDVPGLAARTAIELESENFTIADLTTDVDRTDDRTVVVYHPTLESRALRISELLGGVLISASEESVDGTPLISVFVGKDQEE